MSDAIRSASDAQSRASNPSVSAWVSASAGSGKTRVLVDRVIRLMLRGTDPQRILCLTFTRAAAGEMSNRLFSTLAGWIGLDEAELALKIEGLTGERPLSSDLIAARRLFTKALETPGGLKIQTIHAFCEKLLHRFPVEAGIVPGFRVMDERSSDEMILEIRNDFLRRVGLDPDSFEAGAFATVVSYVNEHSFDRVLKEVLHQRRLLTSLLEPGAFGAGLERLRRFLGLGPDTDLPTIEQEARGDADREGLKAAASVLAGASSSMVSQAARIVEFLEAEDAATAFTAAKTAFCTAKGDPKADSTLITKVLSSQHPGVAEILFAERARIMQLCEQERAVHVVRATESLLVVSLALLGAYESQKRQIGQYDYDDLIDRTLGMLSQTQGAGWVLFKLDGGIEHILIDEAQDTSPPQWQIISAIAEEFFAGLGSHGALERTLFVVGDYKQSIYSFQGADPQAFDDMHRAFRSKIKGASHRFEDVPLSVSFRSTGDILRAVDWVFQEVEAQAGLIPRYGELLAHQPVRVGQAGLVEIWPKETPLPKPPRRVWDAPVDHEDAAHPRARLAEKIAATIAGWIESGALLEAHGRAIRPGDIMVLVRRRDRFVDALVRGLKRRGVPVAGADRLVLTEHVAVLDLVALGRFVLLPEDDLTLACVLKSPLLNRDDGRPIDDEDLVQLCNGRSGSLWSSLNRKVASGLPYSTALSQLRRWFNMADFNPPFAFFSEVLGAGRGREGFNSRIGAEVNDPLDEFLRLTLDYEASHTPSMQGFLHWLMAAETTIKRDMEHGSDEVRIMTVHGSKGLEANIVFLPDTCSPPRKQNDPEILTSTEDELGRGVPFWRLGSAYEGSAIEGLRSRAQQAQKEEYNRLLYVAMTRARDRLYICGYEGVRQASGMTWYDLMLGALRPNAEEIMQPDGSVVWRIMSAQTASAPRQTDQTEAAPSEAAPDWLNRPAPSEARSRLDLSPSNLTAALDGEVVVEPANPSPLAMASDALRFKRGRIIHKLLETLPELAVEHREGAARRYLSGPAHELSQGDQESIWQEVSDILNDPRFAAVFAPGSLGEVSLAGLIQDGTAKVSGRIDRLAITDHEVLIVDYKTNRPPPSRPEDIPPLYNRQLALYADLVRRIFPEKSVRCALLWTYGACLMEVPV